MIRINLLPVKVKRRKVASRKSLYYFIVILIVEIAFLAVWWQKESQIYREITQKNKEISSKITELTKVKKISEEWDNEKKLIEQQVSIFESLKYDKIGVSNMLLFLSYVLSKPEDIPANKDEIKSLEMAGWDPRWDPKRVWIKKIDEKNKILSIEGEAMDHEDVAEFYKRLETGAYFLNIEEGLMEKHASAEIEGLEYVTFRCMAVLNYQVDIEAPVESTGT